MEIRKRDKIFCCCCIKIQRATKAVMYFVMLDCVHMLFWIIHGFFFYRANPNEIISVTYDGKLFVLEAFKKGKDTDANKIAAFQEEINEAHAFGVITAITSLISLAQLGWILYQMRASQNQSCRNDTIIFNESLTYFLYKNLIWYFIVSVAFTFIISYPDSLIEIMLGQGVLTFILIAWWRRSFDAF